MCVIAVLVVLAAAVPAVGAEAESWPRLSGAIVYPRLLAPAVALREERGGIVTAAVGNVQVNQDATNEPQNETSIAVDPTDGAHLVAGWNDWRTRNVSCGFGTSYDGGETWSDGVLTGLPFGAQGDPSIAADASGNVFLGCLSFNGAFVGRGSAIVVGLSNDGGMTFPALTEVVRGGDDDLQDKAYLTVDNSGGAGDGNVYIAWTSLISTDDDDSTFETSDILWARSLDAGQTFSTPMIISDSGINGDGPVPTVGPDGEVYVVWARSGDLQLDRSFDAGLTFGPDIKVSEVTFLPTPLGRGCFFRTNSFPGIDVDRSSGSHRGSVYVVWADYGTGDADVLLSHSRDNGATWSTPVRVNDDSASNGVDQFMPWVSVDPGGRVHVMWYDRRENAVGAGLPCLYDIYRAYSDDGGVTFGANVRVTTETSNAAFDGFAGGFIGDYSGLVATDRGPYPLWCDTRRGQSDVFVDVLPSPSATTTPSVTPVPSHTPTPAPSATATNTVTVTPTLTATASSTPSATYSLAPSNTFTRTGTATATGTPSTTPTPTASHSRTATPTRTASSTPTATATRTFTVTRTATPTRTATRTASATSTASSTRTPTGTPSVTPTRSSTPTRTPTPTRTFTRTATVTPTASATRTPSSAPSVTPTRSATSTRTPTPTRTFTRAATPTATGSHTRTPTGTASPTPSASPSHTVTSTSTATPSPTATPTDTFTSSATPTASHTPEPSATPTPMTTPTATSAPSLTPTGSETPTHTATHTAPPTLTAAPSSTATYSPVETPTSTSTRTFTESATSTRSVTSTSTATALPTTTPTAVASSTASLSPTAAPRPGDVNGDGRVAPDDLDVLIAHLFAGDAPAAADVSADDLVSAADVPALVRLLSAGSTNAPGRR